jgi:hypothetical protein
VVPQVINVEEFGANFGKWWLTMQPSWRKESLLRELPPDADWTVLKRGGSNGLALVVMTLSWWVRAAGENCCAKVSEAIEDLTWVLTHLALEGASKSNGKRLGSEELEGCPSKKK